MKVGVLTHYDVHNHGAHLQNYALLQVLRSFGHDAQSLAYKKNYDFMDEGTEAKYDISLMSIPYYTNYLREHGIGRTVFNVQKKRILSQFRKNNFIVGEYYSRAADLDCVFTGSDEVFSIETGLNPFFWGMGVPCKNICAYAASFGSTTMEQIEKRYAKEYICAGAARLSSISVRDKNSKEIIERLTGIEPRIVCDPVLLYGFEPEKRSFVKPIANEYLLVYAYDNNMNDKNEVEAILAYANEHDLSVVSAGFYHNWCNKNVNVSPVELLRYVQAAKCVVTDTFHGAVLSILMNCSFAVKIRGNQNKVGFLLDEYGLSDRQIKDFDDLSNILAQRIEYGQVNHLIDRKRQESMEFLASCLECEAHDK